MATDSGKVQRAKSPARVRLNTEPPDESEELVALVNIGSVFHMRSEKVMGICERLGINIGKAYDPGRGKTLLVILKSDAPKLIEALKPKYRVLDYAETKNLIEGNEAEK